MSLFERIDAPQGPEELDCASRTIKARRGGSLSRFALPSLLPSLSSLGLGGKVPLRLLAVPKDPIAGDKAAGQEILRGKIGRWGDVINLETAFAGEAGPAPSAYLQSFAWLRDLAAAVGRERGAPIAEHLVRQWLKHHGEAVEESSWSAELWAKRLFFWSAYAPYILSTREASYRSALLGAMARGSRYLARTADRGASPLSRVIAWSGAVTSSLLIQSGPLRLHKVEASLIRALAVAVHEDGGIVSRSPSEQLALVETLAELRSVYAAVRDEMPPQVSEALSKSAAALLGVTLGDGALGSWQGGNTLVPARVAAAAEATGQPVRPLRQAKGWGYQRFEAKKTVVVFDAAPPPPATALKGGCASTLAFEMSDGPHRLIVNCGGPGEARMADQLRRLLRTTAAHSTLTVADRNSAAIKEDGSLGKGVTEVTVTRDQHGGAQRIDARHDGYVRRFGLLHRRRMELSGDGLELAGEDLLERSRRRWRSKRQAFAIRFHLAPGVEVTSTADGRGAILRIRGGSVWQFRCRGGALSSEESIWIDGSGAPVETRQLVVSGESGSDGAAVAWSLKRTR
ncbi:MAG TPA: heparinase II/III family protein [Allosphingosinicella sp.]|nr:heparinase II/III family protein [Allosphingosinicella sp.]